MKVRYRVQSKYADREWRPESDEFFDISGAIQSAGILSRKFHHLPGFKVRVVEFFDNDFRIVYQRG